jgi:hypothetical protein
MLVTSSSTGDQQQDKSAIEISQADSEIGG